jgi:hypothetical protein
LSEFVQVAEEQRRETEESAAGGFDALGNPTMQTMGAPVSESALDADSTMSRVRSQQELDKNKIK